MEKERVIERGRTITGHVLSRNYEWFPHILPAKNSPAVYEPAKLPRKANRAPM